MLESTLARARPAPAPAPAPAVVRLLACALLAAPVRAQSASAPTPEIPPVVEAPPDADVTLDGVERALDLLAAGDKAWQEGRRDAAFDAWRSAIVASRADDAAWGGGAVVAPPPGPGTDADGTLARRAEDCSWTVRRRLALLAEDDRAAWSARFGGLAEIERAAAGDVPELLARAQREFPRTRAAARAAIALGDLAHEHGDPSGAWTWFERAAGDAPRGDAEFAAALARRALRPFPVEWTRRGGAPSLRLERVVELEGATTGRDAAIPGIAVAGALRVWVPLRADGASAVEAPSAEEPGTTWFHGGGRLLRFDPRGDATAALDVRAALRALDVASRPSFSEPGAPWDEAFAAGAGWIALVEGRAREEHGNALVGVEAGPAPRVEWARDSDGLVRDGARVAAPDLAGAPALLEFQPGPLLVGDTLIVHARAWPHGTEGGTELDEARTESWCAGLDPRDGSLRWSRRLATGATLRGMDRGRMEPAEPTSLPAPPPVESGGRIALDTGLGAIAVLDAVDGRVASIVRTARRGARALPAGGVAMAPGAGPVWSAPGVAEGALLRLRRGPDLDGDGLFAAPPVLLRGPRIPVSAGERDWFALAPGARGARLVRQDLASGDEVRSVEIPFGPCERGATAAVLVGDDWIVAAGGRAYAFDPQLHLRGDVDLGPRSAFARVAVAAAPRGEPGTGRPVRVAGPGRIAFLRVE